MVTDYHDLQVLDLIEHLLWHLKEKFKHNYTYVNPRKKKSKTMEYGFSPLVSCATWTKACRTRSVLPPPGPQKLKERKTDRWRGVTMETRPRTMQLTRNLKKNFLKIYDNTLIAKSAGSRPIRSDVRCKVWGLGPVPCRSKFKLCRLKFAKYSHAEHIFTN